MYKYLSAIYRQKYNLHFQPFIDRAAFLADQPVDDSAVVDDMFGFLESQNDNISESQAPSAFRDLPAPKVVQNGDIIPGIYLVLFDYVY